MKKQLTIHLESGILERAEKLQELTQHPSRSQMIAALLERGLASYRQEYRQRGNLSPKPLTDREKYGKAAWNKECQELYGN
jgi:hypothetical protein